MDLNNMWELLGGAYDDNRWRTAVNDLRLMQEDFERNGVPPVLTMGLGAVPAPQVAPDPMNPVGGRTSPNHEGQEAADAPQSDAPEGASGASETPSPETPPRRRPLRSTAPEWTASRSSCTIRGDRGCATRAARQRSLPSDRPRLDESGPIPFQGQVSCVQQSADPTPSSPHRGSTYIGSR